MIKLLDHTAFTCEKSDAPENEWLLQTAVIIPARNEEQSIGLVLGDLPRVGKVIVVDNGSTDTTSHIAQKHGAFIVDEETPGYGRACRVGIHALRRYNRRVKSESASTNGDEKKPIVYVAFLDADYSDHPELLPQLIEPLADGSADFVLGSRLLGEREKGAMPVQSVWGNRLACFLMKSIWGARYTDLGPFRALRLDTLNQLNMKDTNFGWTVEMQVKASQLGLRVLEIPVPYRCRIGTSKISGTVSGTIRASYKILFTIAKYAMLRKNDRDAR